VCGRAVSPAVLAVYADQHAVAESYRSSFTLSPSGMPWADETHELIDDLGIDDLGETAPGGRGAERKARAEQRAAREAQKQAHALRCLRRQLRGATSPLSRWDAACGALAALMPLEELLPMPPLASLPSHRDRSPSRSHGRLAKLPACDAADAERLPQRVGRPVQRENLSAESAGTFAHSDECAIGRDRDVLSLRTDDEA
jgi:hypothetical protein